MISLTRNEVFLHYIQNAKRIVVKIGSSALSKNNGMNIEVIDSLARELSKLHDRGCEVVLVSSGAVAAGRKKLAVADTKTISLQEKQALAAIGQSHLMHIYDAAFCNYQNTIAQILLTHADLSHRKRYLNFKNTMFSLFRLGVIPIINENDTVSTRELQFGDNDNLAALVTNLIEGDLFICLSDVDALYTANPSEVPEAKAVRVVPSITPEICEMAGTSKSTLGTGGMLSKIRAVQKVAAGGGASVLGSGMTPDIIARIFSGEEVGTVFLPERKRLNGRRQWIAFVLKPKGQLILDSGACNALLRAGKSLLSSGIKRVVGEFKSGESVRCLSEDGEILAVGLVRYNSKELRLIVGHKSTEILSILGHEGKTEVIHRDELVLMKAQEKI